jgi:adenosylcobinamide-GDP ribazoletransferase
MDFLRRYLLAMQFFTRVPLTGRLAAWVGYSPEMLRRSVAHFPGVGWLVGLSAALVFVLAHAMLPDVPGRDLLSAVLCAAAGIFLTGALHEDGLADVADGLGGAHERERALAIMKDSRIGAYGVLALVGALLLRVSLLVMLAGLDPSLRLVAGGLVAGHVTSRLLPLVLIRLLPYVSDAGRSKSRALAEQISLTSLLVAALWTAPACVLMWTSWGGAAWLWALLAAVLAWIWMWRLFARRLQGYTGDCLGATQQVCELAFYLGLALAA